ncbi:MAG: hypothetical protein AAB873_03380 [Patescibacteria group bacterium]
MKEKRKKLKTSGYTIIETMIAVSIFLVVTMVGMDSLLNANLVHRKSEDMRSIMDSLSFIMEDMSRNLRTGFFYHCGLAGEAASEDPVSCLNGSAQIVFEPEEFVYDDTSNQWIYKIVPPNIEKSTDGGITWATLNTSDVLIGSGSKFIVSGAEAGDDAQPMVRIRLMGDIFYKNIKTPFALQTTISQRLVDIQ